MAAASDIEAWDKYPYHRRWFDKLNLSLRLGYRCGPGGVAPRDSGWYVVRPIYNLEGMGVGARKQFITAGDSRCVEPGYFWCEWFDGPQHSVTYRWDRGWVPVSSWEGVLDGDGNDLSRFSCWRRSTWTAMLTYEFDELADCEAINVEFVAGRIIEVHLRPSPDPDQGVEIVPVWADQEDLGVDVASFDDAGGFLKVPRVGFRVR